MIHVDRWSEAITHTFTAVEPLIGTIARWAHVNTPAYVVVAGQIGQELRQLTVSDLP